MVTLWADKLREVPGGFRYDLFDAPDLDVWRGKRGNRERIRDLQLARDRADGLFRVVIGRANDSGDAMLEGSVYEVSDIVMRLIDLDEATGRVQRRERLSGTPVARTAPPMISAAATTSAAPPFASPVRISSTVEISGAR